MKRVPTVDIISDFEMAASQFDRMSALFEAIARLSRDSNPDIGTAIELARLGADTADLAGSEARGAVEALQDERPAHGLCTTVTFDTSAIADHSYREHVEESPGFHFAAILRELAAECDTLGQAPRSRGLSLEDGTLVGSIETGAKQ